MNLDWLGRNPVSGRLDALLEKFDDAASDSEGEFDYAKFAASRAQPAAPMDTVESEDEAVPGLDLEETTSNINEGPDTIDSGSIDQGLLERVEDKVTTTKQIEPVTVRVAAESNGEPTHSEPPRTPEHQTITIGEEDEPLDPQAATDEGAADKEYQEREDQRLERLLGREIGHHTTKAATVTSFLAELDAPDSPPIAAATSTPTTSPAVEKSKGITLSSPPRMQTLKSFVGRPRERPESIELSDSDLEIVPETVAGRRSKAVRQMLQFAGRPGDVAAAQMFESLQRKQRDQLVESRNDKIAKLKAEGIDIEAERNLERESLIELERRKAEEIKQQESDWDDDDLSDLDAIEVAGKKDDLSYSGSDSSSESENGAEGPHDGDSEDEHQDSAFENSTRVHRHRMLMSDSDSAEASRTSSESESESESGLESPSPAETPKPQSVPQLAKKENTCFDEPTQPTTTIALASAEATQYVPPVSEELRRAFLRPAHLPPAVENDSDGEPSEEVEEVARSPPRTIIKPDLSNIGGPGISTSQEMVEVRKRFLAAQEKKRLQSSAASSAARPTPATKASKFFDQEAEESDDEWAGLGGSDGDEENDENAVVADLVDDNAPNARQGELQKVWADQQRTRDERLVQQMVQNVHGGFRRRQARGDGDYGFLSDGDDDDHNDIKRAVAEEKRRREERDRRRRQNAIEGNAAVQRLAERESTKAFLDCISDDVIKPALAPAEPIISVEETLSFMRRESHATDEADDSDGYGDDAVLPRVNLDLRAAYKPSNMPAPEARRKSTYAARIAGADNDSSGKQVEILLSLGANANKAGRPGKRSGSRMVAAPAQPTKARKIMTTHSTASKLFERSWNA